MDILVNSDWVYHTGCLVEAARAAITDYMDILVNSDWVYHTGCLVEAARAAITD